MKRTLVCAALLALLLGAACAESATVDLAAGKSVRTEEAYIRVKIPVEEESPVTVTVTDEAGRCVYSRDYGTMAASFRTEEISLKLSGSAATYTVTAQVGEKQYHAQVTRAAGKITGQPACSAGYPLDELTGYGDWQCATLLDMKALNGSQLTTSLLVNGQGAAGTVRFSVKQGKLTVTVKPENAEVERATVYVALTAADAAQLGRKGFSGLKGSAGKAIDLGGASCAAVFVDIRLAYRPGTLSPAPDPRLPGQEAIRTALMGQ